MNIDTQKYYCYILFDPRYIGQFIYDDMQFNNIPFYVGKSNIDSKREKSHERKARLTNINHPTLNLIRNILKTTYPTHIVSPPNLFEYEAFNLERQLIKSIGRLQLNSGPLTNLTAGGEGSSGHKYSLDNKLNNSKLNEVDIINIYKTSLCSNITISDISKIYSVSYLTIYRILHGYSFVELYETLSSSNKIQIKNKLTLNRLHFNEDFVYLIYDNLISGNTAFSLSKKYNIDLKTVYDIANGNTWKSTYDTLTVEQKNIIINNIKSKCKQTGELNGQSKLTESDVIGIKMKLNSGWTQANIAREYSISSTLIWNIKRGKSWSHI